MKQVFNWIIPSLCLVLIFWTIHHAFQSDTESDLQEVIDLMEAQKIEYQKRDSILLRKQDSMMSVITNRSAEINDLRRDIKSIKKQNIRQHEEYKELLRNFDPLPTPTWDSARPGQ